MSNISPACKSCGWEKDGVCYGFGRTQYRVHTTCVDGNAYTHRMEPNFGYPPCPTEDEQNGMPCPQWTAWIYGKLKEKSE